MYCMCVCQPGTRGGSEEIEDYVVEAERLLGLTVVSACTAENPDIRHILQDNWCTDVPSHGMLCSIISHIKSVKWN